MNSISIADQLWFEETILGATLNYRSLKGGESVLFRVGMSFQSLQDCNHQLTQSSCLWTIRDGSLSVQGDIEGITLRFSSANGGAFRSELALYGEELRTFKYAIDAFASRRQTSLN
jgi:hypothetical protein